MASDDFLPGPVYWKQQWGFTDYENFREEAGKFLPHVLPFGNLGFNDAALTLAWLSPEQGVGPLIIAGLTAAGFDAPGNLSGLAIYQALTLWAVQGAQETPMGQLIIPNAFQVNIQALVGGKLIENVIGVVNAGGTAAGAAAAVKDSWEQTGGPLHFLSDQVVMSNYHAVDISSPDGDIADVASTAPGGQSSEALATRASCALIRWNGSTRSRSSRGRLYFGPLAGEFLEDDGATLTSGAQTGFSGAFTTFRTGLSFNSYPLAVLSRVLNQAFLVTSQAVESTSATQRRRLRS